MTVAVSHTERGAGDDAPSIQVLDALRECRPPFSPDVVVAEACSLLRSYRVTRVVGDRYAGDWPPSQFRKHGVEYAAAEKSKSDIYRDFLPLLNSQRVELHWPW